jgi:hypothetical protein
LGQTLEAIGFFGLLILSSSGRTKLYRYIAHALPTDMRAAAKAWHNALSEVIGRGRAAGTAQNLVSFDKRNY